LRTLTPIAFLCSSQSYGGLEMNVLRLSIWMQQRGWPIILYLREGSPLHNAALEKTIPIEFIPRYRKYYPLIKAIKLYRLFQKDKIRIILIRDNRDISISAIVKLLSLNRIKIVFQQAMQIGKSKKDILHTLRYKNIDAWLTSLSSMKNEVIQKTRFPGDRIHIIPLGVDVQELCSNKPNKTTARELLTLPDSAYIIGILGRINRMKGQEFLIQCLNKIRSRDEKIHLLIMGEPSRNESHDYFNYLKKKIQDLGLQDNIHLRGFSNDIKTFFSAIDLFVMASEKETYGMVTIEAMISGVPILASNSGGTSEILQYGRYGTLFIPKDEDDFVIKCLKIITGEIQPNSPELVEEIRELYSHQHECELIEEVLNHHLIHLTDLNSTK
jgi:glycosyltransferase involved in cell wall biosynthesis